jgi:hypothetical protein
MVISNVSKTYSTSAKVRTPAFNYFHFSFYLLLSNSMKLWVNAANTR